MKDILNFLGKVLVIVIGFVLGVWLVSLIWASANTRVASQPEVIEVEVIREVPVWSDRVEMADETDETGNKEEDERLVLGDEVLCEFADDFTAEGLTVPSGTKVTGPAFAKPSRDSDWGMPIYVGEEYTTTESDEVIWLLNGDDACVDAQAQYFTYWEKDNPTN